MLERGQRQTVARLALGAMLLAVCPRLWCKDDSTTRILAGLDIPVILSSTRAALIEIDKCRAALPDADARRQLTSAEESLIEGLLIGWDPDNPNLSERAHWPLQLAMAQSSMRGRAWSWPSESPPAIYLKSLASDARVCKAASLQWSAPESQAALANIIGDLSIKSQDCISHGMGRTIQFKIKTVRGQTPDRGWTVYYKWLTVSNLETDEMPFPRMSTPAFNDLPPGLYRFRAEKRDPASAVVARSETMMCQVDEAHQECEVQVP